MTAARVAEHGLENVELLLVTPEQAPLELFGRAASDAVSELLAARGIEVITRRHPARVTADGVELLPH